MFLRNVVLFPNLMIGCHSVVMIVFHFVVLILFHCIMIIAFHRVVTIEIQCSDDCVL
jgi:hypothetical protein